MRTDITMIHHLGAIRTDNDQLTWSLRHDYKELAAKGVVALRPRTYRDHVNKMLRNLEGDEAPMEEQEELLFNIINNEPADRLLLADSSALGVTSWMLNKGILYQNAGSRCLARRNLFPDNPCEFFLGIKNPATFIPEAFTSQKDKTYREFISDTDVPSVRWSAVIERIKEANPDCPLTVWCNEDTPIIWPTILREVAGLDHRTNLKGDQDVIKGIMTEIGVERLETYMAERPALNEMQRRRVRAIFLEKFYDDEAVEEEIDLPGWTGELVDTVTDVYEDDLETIARIPGVNFISL